MRVQTALIFVKSQLDHPLREVSLGDVLLGPLPVRKRQLRLPLRVLAEHRVVGDPSLVCVEIFFPWRA